MRTLHTMLAVAIALGGCNGNDEDGVTGDPVAPVPVAGNVAPERVPGDGPVNDDGSLRPDKEPVLGAAIPREMNPVAVDRGWAGFEAPYSYRLLIEFYQEELGPTWQLKRGPGGAKFENVETKAAVYVQKPRDAGQKPRVFYFGDTSVVPTAPGGLAEASPAGGAQGLGPQGPGGAQGPGGPSAPAGGQPGSRGGLAGNPSEPLPAIYDKKTEQRDGRDVVVFTRKDDPPPAKPRDDLSRYENGPGYDPFAGERVYAPVPEGVLR